MHGALLIKALQKQDAKAEFRCWGGDFDASRKRNFSQTL